MGLSIGDMPLLVPCRMLHKTLPASFKIQQFSWRSRDFEGMTSASAQQDAALHLPRTSRLFVVGHSPCPQARS